MRLVIEARIDDGVGTASGAIPLAVVERRDRSLSKLGLTLAEGRALLAEAQAALVTQQIDRWMAGESHCRRCGAPLSHKDSRTVVLRTVFGNVAITSPRLWSCRCRAAAGTPRCSTSPLCKALPERITPELEYLQVKWAAYLPYRQAAALLKEVLPLDKAISFSGVRQMIRAVAKDLDAEIDRDIANQPCATANVPPQTSHCTNLPTLPPSVSTRPG